MYHNTYSLQSLCRDPARELNIGDRPTTLSLDREDFQHYMGWITRKNKHRRLILVPGSSFKRFWEYIGLVLLIQQLVSHHHATGSIFGSFLPVTDTYFLIDLFIRMRSGYIDSESGEMILDPDLISSRYTRTWLVFDVLTSLPYEALWIAWKWSAALRLATVSRSTGRSALMSFFGDSAFRSAFVRHSRQHFKEWTTFEDLVMTKSFKRSSLFQKGIHLFVNTIRTGKNMRGLQKFKTAMSWLQNLTLSWRTVLTFSRTLETTFVETATNEDYQ